MPYCCNPCLRCNAMHLKRALCNDSGGFQKAEHREIDKKEKIRKFEAGVVTEEGETRRTAVSNPDLPQWLLVYNDVVMKSEVRSRRSILLFWATPKQPIPVCHCEFKKPKQQRLAVLQLIFDIAFSSCFPY